MAISRGVALAPAAKQEVQRLFIRLATVVNQANNMVKSEQRIYDEFVAYLKRAIEVPENWGLTEGLDAFIPPESNVVEFKAPEEE